MDYTIGTCFLLTLLISVLYGILILSDKSKRNNISICLIDIIVLIIIIIYTVTLLLYITDISTRITLIGYVYTFILYYFNRILFNSENNEAFYIAGIKMIVACFVIVSLYILWWLGISNDTIINEIQNPNHFACFIALGAPIITGYIFSSSKNRAQFFLSLFLLSIMLYALVLTETRTVYCALGLVIPLMIITSAGRSKVHVYMKKVIQKRWISLMVLSGALVLLLSISYYLYQMKPMSFIGRMLIWKVTLKMFLENPLHGLGFGNLANSYNLFQTEYFASGNGTALQKMVAGPSRHAFNWYLETAAEAGITGIIVFGMFWILIIKHVWQVFYRHWKGLSHDYITLGLAGSVLCFMLMSLFHFPRKILPTYMLFFVFLAWIVTQSPDKNYMTIKAQYVRFIHYGLVAITLVFSILFFPKYIKWYMAGREWKRAHELACDGKYTESLRLYSNAYARLSWNGRFCAYYGDVLMQTYDNSMRSMSNSYLGTNTYTILKQAIRLYEQAKYTWPDPYLFEHLGCAYADIGEYNRAIAYWQLSSNILPWRLTPKWYCANLFRHLGDTNNAVTYASSVVNTPMKKYTVQGVAMKEGAQSMLIELGVSCDDPGRVVFNIHDRKTWNEGRW